jgi:sulfonate transport system ATP-binding protein
LPRPRERQSAAFDFVKRRVLAALDRSLDRTAVTDDRQTKGNRHEAAQPVTTKASAGAALWW